MSFTTEDQLLSHTPDPSQESTSFWRPFWQNYLYFFYFSGLYQIIIFSSGIAGGTGLRQAIYMSFLWLIPLLLLPRYSKVISATIGLLLWASSLMTMGYLALYEQDFSQSVLFIMFESNTSESKEFLESYYKWWMLPALIIYTLIPFLLWKYSSPIYASTQKTTIAVIIIALIVSWPAFNRLVIQQDTFERAISKQINRMEPVAPWHLVMGYVKYKKTLHDIEQHLLVNKSLAPLEGLSDKNALTKNTLVLVIGESTNRQRMSLYGYQRNTSPKLSALKDELLILNNVYSPRPYTIETLEQVLTFADEKSPDLYLEKPTLINLMKQAGYKTYWITNQQTQTKRNTLLTTFSKQADEQIYLNNNRMQDSSQYDEVVIKPFKKILTNKEQKKFIVIHLLGTHRKYHYRYPENFALFDHKIDLPNWLNNDQAEEYNEYDNAVLYNDHVVASLIQLFKDSKDNGFLTYFSDHGEEVYDNPEHLFAGRTEAAPSSQMYTIPFILWTSPQWQNNNTIADKDKIEQRAYSTSDFIYTWADLAGITFKEFDASRSVVNKDFSPHPIWIGNPYKPEQLRDLQKQPFAGIKAHDHKKCKAVVTDEHIKNSSCGA